jgi:tryptophan synthase beta chain
MMNVIFQSVSSKAKTPDCRDGGADAGCVHHVDGGSNAMETYAFRDDENIDLVVWRQAGAGLPAANMRRVLPIDDGTTGVLQGRALFVLKSSDGQIMNTHSVSAGLITPRWGGTYLSARQMERAFYTLLQLMKRL